MTVHLHTVCWNDSPILPYFFRHYDSWVDRYYIYDDGSSDGSAEWLQSHPKVVYSPLRKSHPDSWVLSAKSIYDSSWRRSIGAADWVIVNNLDELLFHPAMPRYLKHCQQQGVTAIPAMGVQMISEQFPSTGGQIYDEVTSGAPWGMMSKLQLFDPNAMDSVQFTPGRHRVALKGRVRMPAHDEVLNLHCKYLGMDYTARRHGQLKHGLGSLDNEQRWGYQYHLSKQQLNDEFARYRSRVIDVMDEGCQAVRAAPGSCWWRQESVTSNNGT